MIDGPKLVHVAGR